MRGGRLPLLALALALPAAPACREEGRAPPQAGLAPTALPAPGIVPELDGLEPEVRRQIEEAREALESERLGGRARGQRLGRLGQVYQAYDFREAALECYGLAMELDPREPRWPHLSGVLNELVGRSEEAIAHFRRAAAAAPPGVATDWRLADLLLKARRADEAAPFVERVLAGAPAEASSWELAGRLRAQRGEDEQAVAAFERALELEPSADSLNVPLGQSLRRLGQEERAQQVLERAGGRRTVLSDPILGEVNALKHSAASRLSAALFAIERGELDKAESDLRRVLELDPDSASAHANLGVIFERRGQRLAAVEQFETALAVQPSHVLARYDLATVLSDLGRDEEAVDHYLHVLALEPTNVAAHFNLGNSLSWSGRHAEAVEHYARAVELDPSLPERHLALALAAASAGDWRRAREAAEAGVAAHPADRRLRLLLARLLACSPIPEERDPQRAALAVGELLRELVDLGAVEISAMAFAELGRSEEAARMQARALQAAEGSQAEEHLPRLRHHLELYERGERCDRPWPEGDPVLNPVNPALR